MKLFSKFLCLSAVALGLAACDRDYEMPPLNPPVYNGGAANTTIAQLRSLGAAATQANPVTITDSLILRARVSGNDVSGNVYKKIFVQDATGNFEIEVDQSGVHNDYPAGQEVFINLKGLVLAVYGGELQLGQKGLTANRIPYETFKARVQKNGWADTTKLQVIETKNLKSLKVDDITTHNALVKLVDVKFENGGTGTFATTTGYGTQNLVDAHGNKLLVRTSNYADFAADKLPKGWGTVYGILGVFNNSYQLTIRKRGDIQAFDSTKVVLPQVATATLPYTNTLGGNSLGDFTIENKMLPAELSAVWTTGKSYVKATAYNAANKTRHASESYLLSPYFDLTGKKDATLSFEHVGNFFNFKPLADYCTLWARVEGGKWEQVTIPTYSTGKDWNFVSSGKISLAAYAGKKVQLGFKYVSTNEIAGTWEIKNVSVE